MGIAIAVLITLVIVCLVAVVVLALSNARLWIKLGALENSTHKVSIFNPDPANDAAYKQMLQGLRNKIEDGDDPMDMDSLE